jgi:hypothetical protein
LNYTRNGKSAMMMSIKSVETTIGARTNETERAFFTRLHFDAYKQKPKYTAIAWKTFTAVG